MARRKVKKVVGKRKVVSGKRAVRSVEDLFVEADEGAMERAKQHLFSDVVDETSPVPDYRDAGNNSWVSHDEWGSHRPNAMQEVMARLNTHDAGFQYVRDQMKQIRMAIEQLQQRVFTTSGRAARF